MILVDTTPLVALCDARDSRHRVALKHLESLAADEFAVCDAVQQSPKPLPLVSMWQVKAGFR